MQIPHTRWLPRPSRPRGARRLVKPGIRGHTTASYILPPFPPMESFMSGRQRSETSKSSRRQVLQAASAIAAAAFVGDRVRAASYYDKLRIAVIGCGGRGGGNLQSVSSEHIVSLCDVNKSNLGRAAESHSQARKNTDFRRIFDHSNEFDAVVVSTCEHTHAFATLPALQLGKHVYCEKPPSSTRCRRKTG